MNYDEVIENISYLQDSNPPISKELERIKKYIEEQEDTLSSLCIALNAATYGTVA